ncbi:MAG TPA: hypothetical protein VKC89_02250 [Patescibacteria group bacterium]|nr:hypothetical protein [Patescibacteria group bacterium]
MPEFKFIQNQATKKWVIQAPRRAKRPIDAKTPQKICPFCLGQEGKESELYRVGGIEGDSNWQIRVLPNKYPFAPIHEIIIHSPDHHKNFTELDPSSVELIFKTYRQRFQTHKEKGKVYIFHNRGEGAGESLVHPHSQLVVIPDDLKAEIQPLNPLDQNTTEMIQTINYNIFCPETSEWPDEVWIFPKQEGKVFGEISEPEIADLSVSLVKILKILEIKHSKELAYNFYIYPDPNWYLRIMPRARVLGGFELGTNIYVNTQDPKETLNFLKEHF